MNLSLYVVTDSALSGGKTHEEVAKAAVSGGTNVIQLRDKDMSGSMLFETAKRMRAICEGRAIFIVNDRLDVAIAANADGVHLGQDDLPVRDARGIAPENFIIGVSVGSVDEALKGVADGANYLAVSPVFSTVSKADAGEGHGVELIKEIRKVLPKIPLVAIGGINKNNAAELIVAGLDGVAVISAVVSSRDIKSAARELSGIVRDAKSGMKRNENENEDKI